MTVYEKRNLGQKQIVKCSPFLLQFYFIQITAYKILKK